MKAIVYRKYGSPDTLRLEDVPKPVPGDHEVLVRVQAASINSWDWDMIRGRPLVVRMWGLFRPRYRIPGCDLAGVVEATGKEVKAFKPGDEVYGDMCEQGFGAFAEYKCSRADGLRLKSPAMRFEEAAAIPQAATLALQALQDTGKIKPGQHLLINGAGGAVGTFAVQIAKLHGAEVTGVDHPSKFEMMRSLGFDHLVDYTREDFTRSGRQYDMILDVRTDRSLFAYMRVLRRKGIYLTVGGNLGLILAAYLIKWWPAIFRKKYYRLVAMRANRDLPQLNELVESGKLRPLIGHTYPLTETAAAFRLFSSGLQKGKIVISIRSTTP